MATRVTGPGATGRSNRSTSAAITLSLLLVALIAVLAGVFALQSRRDARDELELRARSAAYMASAHVRWVIEANLQALQRVVDHAGASAGGLGDIQVQDLRSAVAALPDEVSIRVFDARGRPVMSTEQPPDNLSVDSRDYFVALRDGADPYLGPMIVSRASGRKVVPIGRRIVRNGAFAGAAVIYLPAHLLADFWASMNLGAGSTIGLLRDDGWLMARYPVPEQTINLANYVLFTQYLPKAPSGTYEAEASPADGVGRIVAYQRIEGLPLVTVVGIPTSTASARVRERLDELGLLVAPVGFALLVTTGWVLLLMRREQRANAALAEALEQNRILFREIHHRVKNNLQTVAALVRLQPGPAAGKDDLMRRIGAMSAVHEHIYASDQFARMTIDDYIRTLVASLREGYGSPVTVDCALAPIAVAPDHALPLGLIINEVVSNAFKHAFPNQRPGRISISLDVAAPGRAQLRIADDGIGFTPGGRTGMGSRLIAGLAQQLEGRFSFRTENGTVFELEFPIPEAGTDPASAREAA